MGLCKCTDAPKGKKECVKLFSIHTFLIYKFFFLANSGIVYSAIMMSVDLSRVSLKNLML